MKNPLDILRAEVKKLDSELSSLEYRRLLTEVNQPFVNQEIDNALELHTEICASLLQKNTIKVTRYTCSGRPVFRLIIDKRYDDWPNIYLVNGFDNADTAAEFRNIPKGIFIDVLDKNDNIDIVKLRKFINEPDDFFSIVHELNHDINVSFNKTVGKKTIFPDVNNKKEYYNSDIESAAYTQQFVTMMYTYFVPFMKDQIHMLQYKEDIISLDKIFYNSVNKFIYDILKNHRSSAEFFKYAIDKTRNKMYQYLYSEAKELFEKYHNTLESTYLMHISSLPSKV